MKRLTVPKLAVILATLASFAWIVVLYATPLMPANGPRAAIILAIPVGVSLWGFSSDRFRKPAGVVLLVFAFAIFLVSVWMIGLCYVPSAVLLFFAKGPRLTPRPSHFSEVTGR
jgi:hypothetical protein